MWRRRAQKESQEPVVLPSLDRLSGLIERVVELVDAVAEPTPVPAPEPVPEPPVDAPPPVPAIGWIAFASSPHGYRLVESTGAPPARGGTVELEGAPHLVVKVGPSPLPGDRRLCAYVERQEPSAADRSTVA